MGIIWRLMFLYYFCRKVGFNDQAIEFAWSVSKTWSQYFSAKESAEYEVWKWFNNTELK